MVRAISPSLILCAALPLAAAGCAGPRPLVTWEEAIEAPPTARRAPSRAPRAPTSAPRPSPRPQPAAAAAPRSPEDEFGGGGEGESAVRTPAGVLIDRALTRFHADRKADKRRSRRSHKHAIRWLRLLAEIDDAATLQPTADDLGAFVRARVTLEVEHQRDKDRRRALPPDLGERIDRTLGALDSRVAELRLVAPPGSMGPSRGVATSDDVLLLRPPVAPMVITSPFGVRDDPIHGHKRFHAGLDFGAPKGSMVYASAKAVVIFANWQGGYGRHVVLDHGAGIRTHYSHLDEIFVEAGEVVDAGDTIGAVGDTGRATGPHLHYAVTNGDGQFLDPAQLIDREVVRRDVADLQGHDRRRRARARRLATRD